MNHHDPELGLVGAERPGVVAENCRQCAKPFAPHKGGKPQRFCSDPCRMAFHAKQREADKATLEGIKQRDTLQSIPPATTDPKTPLEPTGEDFDWNTDDSVILREQPVTAAYFNPQGELVIRQARWPDDDIFIYVAQNNVADFLDKLTDRCGVPSFGKAK